MTARLHATANEFASDPDPQVTRRAIVELLSTTPWLTRGAIHLRLYGSSTVGAGRVASALGALRSDGYVWRTRDRRYALTELGELWAAGAQVFDQDGAS